MYAVASKRVSKIVHIVGTNGFTLCGRVIIDTMDSAAGFNVCTRCNTIDMKANPITGEESVPTDNDGAEYGLTAEEWETVIAQEMALASINPFESSIPASRDSDPEYAEIMTLDVESGEFRESTTEEIETVTALIVSDSIIIPANPIMGPMMTEFGFTAHGNTYSVDYNRVIESMRTPKPIETVAGDADHDMRVSVAIRMNLPHLAAMTPVELKAELPEWINIAHMWASDENATIDEAYGAHCEDNGITIPAYLACRKAHSRKGEIKSGGFWNCCEANPTHVVTFDDGAKQAVCKGCANAYSGEVADIPADVVTAYKCVCGDSYLATQDDWDNALAEIDAMPVAEETVTEETVTEETISEESVSVSIAPHSCATWDRAVRMSDCDNGCKIYGCEKCGRERLIHNRMYGCRK
jgi:hypothetical protein